MRERFISKVHMINGRVALQPEFHEENNIHFRKSIFMSFTMLDFIPQR